LVPILGVVVCGAMMAALPWDTWLRLVLWLLIGMVVYFRYGAKHSRY
jgi:APA family basic amino acid/polyamine antiporter